MDEPQTTPSPTLVLPPSTVTIEIMSSGAALPKATSVTPAISSLIPVFFWIASSHGTSHSSQSSASPMNSTASRTIDAKKIPTCSKAGGYEAAVMRWSRASGQVGMIFRRTSVE